MAPTPKNIWKNIKEKAKIQRDKNLIEQQCLQITPRMAPATFKNIWKKQFNTTKKQGCVWGKPKKSWTEVTKAVHLGLERKLDKIFDWCWFPAMMKTILTPVMWRSLVWMGCVLGLSGHLTYCMGAPPTVSCIGSSCNVWRAHFSLVVWGAKGG